MILAADVGGTAIKLGIVEQGRVIAQSRIAVADHSHLQPLLEQMAHRWDAMLSQIGRSRDQAAGVALAFAGIVDTARCKVAATNHKFVDATQVDLAQWAQQMLGLPLRIDNDARAALIGEWRMGSGRSAHDLVMVTLGTGIGGAAIVDGQVLRASHGMAGILGGHLTVNLHGRRCTCGNIGCAEAEASTDRLRELVESTAQQQKLDAPWRNNPQIDYALVFAQAEVGDPLACAVRDYSIEVWSAAAVSLIHAYGAQCVVIGGGIAHGEPQIISEIQKYVDAHAWTPWGRVQVYASLLGDQAALVGCEGLFNDTKGEVL